MNVTDLDGDPAYSEYEAGTVLEKDRIITDNEFTFTAPWVYESSGVDKWIKVTVEGVSGDNNYTSEWETIVYLKVKPIYNYFTYNVDEDGNAVITSYGGPEVYVNIPSEIDARRVVGIGEDAFNDAKINGVEIPSSVVSIGEGAFANCTLNSISIPESKA